MKRFDEPAAQTVRHRNKSIAEANQCFRQLVCRYEKTKCSLGECYRHASIRRLKEWSSPLRQALYTSNHVHPCYDPNRFLAVGVSATVSQ